MFVYYQRPMKYDSATKLWSQNLKVTSVYFCLVRFPVAVVVLSDFHITGHYCSVGCYIRAHTWFVCLSL